MTNKDAIDPKSMDEMPEWYQAAAMSGETKTISAEQRVAAMMDERNPAVLDYHDWIALMEAHAAAAVAQEREKWEWEAKQVRLQHEHDQIMRDERWRAMVVREQGLVGEAGKERDESTARAERAEAALAAVTAERDEATKRADEAEAALTVMVDHMTKPRPREINRDTRLGAAILDAFLPPKSKKVSLRELGEAYQDMLEAIGKAEQERDAALALLRESRRGHADDCMWLGLAKCDCGALEWNARIDALLGGPSAGAEAET